MVPEALAKLERALRGSSDIPEATRRELLDLVAGLQAEIVSDEPGGRSHGSASGVAQALATSVRQLEATHPHLVEMVNQVAFALSNLGI
jgi:hypothetical protein